jgi:HTH-type transcriptional regulator, sugar sensing transcriptional regulator
MLELKKEIMKLGLSEKEAGVYLSSLELGPSSVQAISKKAKVNRATVYVIIDSLMDMGLMSTFAQDKKTFFVAEKPERLLDFLKNQEKSVQERIDILKEKMSELKSISSFGEKRPKVKYFEGIEGLRAVQMDFIETLDDGGNIYTFLPLDEYLKANFKNKVSDIVDRRSKKHIKMKIIYTSRNGEQRDYVAKEEKKGVKTYAYVDQKKYPFSGGVNIYGSKIFMIDYLGKMGGIVIENETLAKTLASVFHLTWDSLEKNKR